MGHSDRIYHGLSKMAFYSSYNAMLLRCYNKTRRDYKYYGALGITVCDRWRESAANFYADMGDRPFPGAELDRIDSYGNYDPSNCRWISHAENNRNRRINPRNNVEHVKVRRDLLCSDCALKNKIVPL